MVRLRAAVPELIVVADAPLVPPRVTVFIFPAVAPLAMAIVPPLVLVKILAAWVATDAPVRIFNVCVPDAPLAPVNILTVDAAVAPAPEPKEID